MAAVARAADAPRGVRTRRCSRARRAWLATAGGSGSCTADAAQSSGLGPGKAMRTDLYPLNYDGASGLSG